MSTPQSIPHLTPRFHIGLGTVLTALGVLIAIAVTITILTLTGTSQTSVTSPVTAPQGTDVSVPEVHYLGPRQTQALSQTTSQSGSAAASAPRYTCLGDAQRCLR